MIVYAGFCLNHKFFSWKMVFSERIRVIDIYSNMMLNRQLAYFIVQWRTTLELLRL